jgi:hypothetical protein
MPAVCFDLCEPVRKFLAGRRRRSCCRDRRGRGPATGADSANGALAAATAIATGAAGASPPSAVVDPYDPQPQLPLFEREAYIASADDAAPIDDCTTSDDASDDATAAGDISVRDSSSGGVFALVGERNFKAVTCATKAPTAVMACVRACLRGALTARNSPLSAALRCRTPRALRVAELVTRVSLLPTLSTSRCICPDRRRGRALQGLICRRLGRSRRRHCGSAAG